MNFSVQKYLQIPHFSFVNFKQFFTETGIFPRFLCVVMLPFVTAKLRFWPRCHVSSLSSQLEAAALAASARRRTAVEQLKQSSLTVVS